PGRFGWNIAMSGLTRRRSTKCWPKWTGSGPNAACRPTRRRWRKIFDLRETRPARSASEGCDSHPSLALRAGRAIAKLLRPHGGRRRWRYDLRRFRRPPRWMHAHAAAGAVGTDAVVLDLVRPGRPIVQRRIE